MKSEWIIVNLFFGLLLLIGTSLAQPVVSLGDDASVCGGITLDAGNAGASFMWSTGDTNQTIFADSSGLYWVEVTDGSGTSRDSIQLVVVPQPTLAGLGDTSLCGGDISLIPDRFPSDVLLWYDSMSGGKLVHIGDTLSGSFVDTTRFYLTAMNIDTTISAGAAVRCDGGAATRSGLRFDALQPFLLQSVTVNLSGPASFTIYLTDFADRIIDSADVSVVPDASGQAVVPLYFNVPVLNNGRLLAGNFKQGALCFARISGSFPFTVPDILVIERGLFLSGIYYYFYDWKISPTACQTPRTAYTANILPTPNLNLGVDTVVCGSPWLLDASWPGASYNWSTGDTTGTLSVDTAGQYGVTVSLGQCVISDSIALEFVDAPVTPTTQDTVICGPELVSLDATLPPGSGSVYWYDAPVGGELIVVQDQGLDIQVLGDTTVYATNRTRLLYPFNVGINQAASGYLNQRRGLQFNVEQKIIIEEVTMYALSYSTFRVYLTDANGTIIQAIEAESPRNIGIGIPFQVRLNFEVEPGNGYRLMADNIQGGSLGIQNPGPQYPLIYPGVMEITNGFTVAGAYYYFFNWVISKAACEGPRVPKNINVSLPINLPESLYACDDTTLTAGIPAASYQWSTTETTPDINVSNSGTYILTVSDGGNCTVSDTTVFTKALPAGLAADGVLCGEELMTNYGPDAVFLWSTSDTTPTITLTDTGRYAVTIVEPRGCVLEDSIHVTGFADFPMVDLGRGRTACVQDTLDAGNMGATFLWSNGDTTQTTIARATGFYSVEVTNSDGCTSADTIALTIIPKPTADFGFNITGFEVCFLNFSPSFGTYTWIFGDGGTDNNVQPCHTYVDTGTYTVSLIASNQCGDDTLRKTVRIVNPNSIQQPPRLEFSIQPNPAKDQVQILIPTAGLAQQSRIELMSLEGKMLLTKSFFGQPEPLQVGQLATGMYMLRIRQGNKQGIAKLQILK
jgi:hypothetical protein